MSAAPETCVNDMRLGLQKELADKDEELDKVSAALAKQNKINDNMFTAHGSSPEPVSKRKRKSAEVGSSSGVQKPPLSKHEFTNLAAKLAETAGTMPAEDLAAM